MNPFEIKEMQELRKNFSEVTGKTKAFENAKSEGKFHRHLPTINEGLKGEKYPDTNIEFKRHVFMLNGEVVDGVFPKFDSKFDTVLPKELRKASDPVQFKHCSQQLAKQIEKDPVFANQFTPRQLEQIQNGEPRISGLTWHHNEVPGKMQLIDANEHNICRHTGGRSLWGGGTDCR